MSIFSMAKTVLKSLFRKPATVKYPFGPREYVKGTRGKVLIDIAKCIYCGMCQRKCPTTAIVVNKTDKTWEIDRMRCVSCNYCVEVCPKKCLSLDTAYTVPTTIRLKEKSQGCTSTIS
ncbi:MAG TPA: 4Fe-4S binding protein [Candidatus Omnitrophota bacterium]|nr:4Fe-4S binding protein [Candidatus Omnitrophota bacterium]HPT07833.1 4Fe-4S binding protein [Candidatus Omnitrophota bacterium]